MIPDPSCLAKSFRNNWPSMFVSCDIIYKKNLQLKEEIWTISTCFQEYWVLEIFFHNNVLRLFSTSEWCTSIWLARPLSVTQVRSCFSKSPRRSDGAPKSRKSCSSTHTFARLGCTTSVLHCFTSRSQVAVQSRPYVQSALVSHRRPLRNPRTTASDVTLCRLAILQSYFEL